MPHYDRPRVDEIRNLTPAIVVDQRPIGSSSRSTVGTAVDVAPLLRLLFSRRFLPHFCQHYRHDAPRMGTEN